MLRTKVFMVRALLTAAVVLAAAPASGQDAVPIITPTMPNYVGFGLGVTTDDIGADDYFFGGLPLARYQFEGSDRYASLVGTFVDLNLINHPIIRFGPTAQLRLGRSNVSDRLTAAALDRQDDRGRRVRRTRVPRPERSEKASPARPAGPAGPHERA